MFRLGKAAELQPRNTLLGDSQSLLRNRCKRDVCIDLTEQDVNLVVKEKGPQEQVEMRGRVFVTVSLADLLGSLGDPQRLGKLFL